MCGLRCTPRNKCVKRSCGGKKTALAPEAEVSFAQANIPPSLGCLCMGSCLAFLPCLCVSLFLSLSHLLPSSTVLTPIFMLWNQRTLLSC